MFKSGLTFTILTLGLVLSGCTGLPSESAVEPPIIELLTHAPNPTCERVLARLVVEKGRPVPAIYGELSDIGLAERDEVKYNRPIPGLPNRAIGTESVYTLVDDAVALLKDLTELEGGILCRGHRQLLSIDQITNVGDGVVEVKFLWNFELEPWAMGLPLSESLDDPKEDVVRLGRSNKGWSIIED